MDNNKLYELLEIPEEVTKQLATYEKTRSKEIPDDIYTKLFLRTEWDEGVKELQTFLGNDTLPENTLLQRELKQYLLAGNVFGIAKGHIK